MKTLILKLDPATREELYSDMGEPFMDFVLMEAVYNILGGYQASSTHWMDAIHDTEYYLNDPDAGMAASVETLLDALKTMEEGEGVLGTDTDEYVYDLEANHAPWVSDKLALAVASLSTANNPDEFMLLFSILADPGLSRRFSFHGRHLGNMVVMMLEGDVVENVHFNNVLESLR